MFVQVRSATFLKTFFFLRLLRVESLELLELALSALHVQAFSGLLFVLIIKFYVLSQCAVFLDVNVFVGLLGS